MSLVFICCLYKYDVLFLCFILLIFSKLFFCDFFVHICLFVKYYFVTLFRVIYFIN